MINKEKSKYKKLNGNVYELPVSDPWWLIDLEDKENNDDDKESRRRESIKLASVNDCAENEDAWHNYWAQHPEGHNFPTVDAFRSWILSVTDFDPERMMAAGGIVKNKKINTEGILTALHPADALLLKWSKGNI